MFGPLDRTLYESNRLNHLILAIGVITLTSYLVNSAIAGVFGLPAGPFNVYSWWGIVWAHLMTYSIAIKVMLLVIAIIVALVIALSLGSHR